MALTAAMSVATRSLEVFQTGIEVAGQNIANANTPGYVREQLQIETGVAYQRGRFHHGTGANLESIKLAFDQHLELQIHAANSDLAASDARQEAYLRLEAAIAELGTGDLSTQTNAFISALNEFANEPTLPGLRELVITEGQSLASAINYTSEQVAQLQDTYRVRLEASVEEANSLINQIQDLNKQIVKLEGGGAYASEATILRTDRLSALDRLSEIVEIQVTEQPTGRVDVRAGREYLIIDGTTQGFETFVPNADAGDQAGSGFGVRFAGTKQPMLEGSGEIVGMLSARDDVLGGFEADLDAFAATFAFEFNKVHSQGSGDSGFTSIVSEKNVLDSTVVLNDNDATGLAFVPSHGSFNVVVQDTVTGVATTTSISVDLDGIGGNDTTLDSLAADINAVGSLNASVDGNGALRITTDAGYELRFDGDSSGVLAALGINTFFSGTDAESIHVSDIIRDDPSKLASGQGGGPGDSSNALELIQFFEQPLDSFGGRSFDEQYQALVYEVAQGSAAEQSLFEGFNLFHDSLVSQREQTSGVSIDEETVRLMQFQHSYQAAARVLSTINELMNVLLNI